MRIALAMTIRNEEDLLRHNILFHRYLGVDRFYLFCDGTTDRGAASVADLPYVTILSSVDAALFADVQEMARQVRLAKENSSARQMLNVFFAMTDAIEKGFDWLISLDADELICTDVNTLEKGCLKPLFAGLPSVVECVSFRNLEVVQRRFEYRNVFAQEVLFKSRDYRAKRKILDPSTGRTFITRGFYGHRSGKSAVRLSAPVIPKTTHRFVRSDGSKPVTMAMRYLLHYYCYSYSHFMTKCRNFHDHPGTYVYGGAVEKPKLVWRKLVNDKGNAEQFLREYFRQWIMFNKEDIEKGRRKRLFGVFPRKNDYIEVTAPSKVMKIVNEEDVK
jgi:hypothetical protein